jgi:molybdate transport system substrate-binding protein
MIRSRIRSAAVLLVVAVLAAACGGGESSGGAPSGGAGSAAAPAEIKVFAARSLTAAFTKLGERYTAAHPDTRVTFNFAGSQALAGQIQQGAPADVFASADTTNMDKVASMVTRPQVFTSNLLQIIVARDNPRDIKGLADLSRGDLKVVLAAPEVPAGRYASQALEAQDVTVKPVSLEDNVKGVVTKVSLGEADAGIVYVTDVTAGGDQVEGVGIPADQNVPATYPIAVVKASTHQRRAQDFVDLVRSPHGQQVLQSFGFVPPAT